MQRVFIARKRDTDPARCPQFSFDKKDRRVTVFYFYLWDAGFGPAFIKVCTYCPWPVKIWVNGHEWAKQQCRTTGLGFTELSNGFASCEDPALLQRICDVLQPGTIDVFSQRWLSRLPLPLGQPDQQAGNWWECSMAQVEVSRTIVFDAPRHARGFFDALVTDNLDLGRPDTIEIIFDRQIRNGRQRTTGGVFKTKVITRGRSAPGPTPAPRRPPDNRTSHRCPSRSRPAACGSLTNSAQLSKSSTQRVATLRPGLRPEGVAPSGQSGGREMPRGPTVGGWPMTSPSGTGTC